MNDPLSAFSVPMGATIHETMAAIDAGSVEIALVLDDDGRLVGTVSDGDVRRALLGGARLDDQVAPIASVQFTWVPIGTDRAAVLDVMRARFISQVPVLDEAGRVVGLHLMRELIGGEERPNVAVVMAGGQGTRLRPLTERIPKPMMPVAGRPILERIVLHLVGSGIQTVFLAVNYMGGVIEEHFADGSRFGCRIQYLREDPTSPLGTAGALSMLPRSTLEGGYPLLVMNGDLLTHFHIGGLLDHHVRLGAIGTVGTRPYVHEVPFGVVEVAEDLVMRIEEKPTPVWDVNAGVYVLEPDLVSRVPEGRSYDMTELLADCIARSERVGAFPLEGYWLDVGRVEDLRRARGELG